ncbi:MAG: alanine racemase, partial [bacterium]
MSLRPAWVEIDLAKLGRNFALIKADKPEKLAVLAVVKDQAYGHGAVEVARVALEHGVRYFGVATIDEGLELRREGILAPILVFGERTDDELRASVEHNLTCCINDLGKAQKLASFASGKRIPIHVEIDTGLSRYGVRWREAPELIESVAKITVVEIEGLMSHFAMSDEADKTFALKQLGRFREVLSKLGGKVRVKYRHMCNTGGYLDLPDAHFDMVRIGILPLGVYPSKVCRRIDGLQPVMSVKSRIAAIRELASGDVV